MNQATSDSKPFPEAAIAPAEAKRVLEAVLLSARQALLLSGLHSLF